MSATATAQLRHAPSGTCAPTPESGTNPCAIAPTCATPEKPRNHAKFEAPGRHKWHKFLIISKHGKSRITCMEEINRSCATVPQAPTAATEPEQPPLFPAPTAAPAPTPATDTNGMPAWLLRALEERTCGFRAARWERCPRCHAITLHGPDADTAAIMVRADPTPLTLHQEQLCRIAGRDTFTVHLTEGTRAELDYRDQYSQGRPTRYPIVPGHRCGARFPGFLTTTTSTNGATHNEPPF